MDYVGVGHLDPDSVITHWETAASIVLPKKTTITIQSSSSSSSSSSSLKKKGGGVKSNPSFIDLQLKNGSFYTSKEAYSLPTELVHTKTRVSGNSYDADGMDEDFIIAVNAGKITTKAHVSSFGSSSSSSAHASNSASSSKGSALIDITGLEASIEALERESFVENSRTVLLARSMESDRALEQAKAGVLKAVQVYRAIREKGSLEGPALTKKKVAQEGSAGEREVPAPTLPIAASASSVSKKRSFAASSDSSIEKKGQPPTKKAAIANHITASLPDTIMPTAVAVVSKNLDVISTADNTDFFVPLERGIALLDVVRQQLENTLSDIADAPSQSGGLLPSETKISTSSGPLESEKRQGILSSGILELVYWYWRKKRSTEAQVVQKQHLKNLKEANQEMNQSSVNENFARCGFLLRSHQTVAPGDLPSEASVNVLARIIGLDRVAVAKVPSHSKGASSVPSVAAAKILADAAAAAKKRTAAGGVDGIVDDQATVEAPPPLTLFLSRTGVVSDRLRTKDVESNLRALIRMRTLRQHLERLRLLLDLARRREKLRRARLHMISDAIEAVLPVQRTSSSTASSSSSSAVIAPPISISGEEFFDYSTSAAATAIPSQGRVRTPQLQSQMSETIAARAITYPRRRNQGRLTTWVNGHPPMYRQLLENKVYEEVIVGGGGGGGDGGNGSGEGRKQKGEVLVEALRTTAPSPLHSPAAMSSVTARSSQCNVS